MRKLDGSILDRIIEEYERGLSVTEIAAELPVSRRTIYRKMGDSGFEFKRGRRAKRADAGGFTAYLQAANRLGAAFGVRL